jgi:YVTN family beta-propeller protein
LYRFRGANTHPSFIAINEGTNTVYVANSMSGTVSVIDGDNNSWIKDVRVGDHPKDIRDYTKFRIQT